MSGNKSGLLRILIAGLLAVALAACSSTESHDDDGAHASKKKNKKKRKADAAMQAPAGSLDLAWERENFGGQSIRALFSTDDLIYAVTADDALHAIGADGVHRWISKDLTGVPTAPPVMNSWGVAFLVGSDLFVFERTYGNLTLKKRLPFPPAAVPAMTDSTLFVSTFVENRIHTVDLDSGLSGWSYRTAEGVVSSPVVIGDLSRQTLFFAGLDGEVTALPAVSADSLAPSAAAWRRSTNDTNTADLVTDGTTSVFLASEDTKLYAFDRITGVIQWAYPTGSPLEEAPYLGDGMLYQPVEGDLLAIDASTGELKWTFEGKDARAVASVGNKLYVRDGKGKLHQLDAGSGTYVRAVDVDQGKANTAASELLLVAKGSHLKAYRL